jgi:hypothetical protein
MQPTICACSTCLLQHCPNLEDLHIPRIHGLALVFSHGSWPHLKRLSFGYGDIPPREENDAGIQRYLNTHLTLERLCLPDHSQATWSVSGLPNLKALDARMHLDLCLAWFLHNLRVMNVFCSKPANELLVSIVEAVPHLERLHFE